MFRSAVVVRLPFRTVAGTEVHCKTAPLSFQVSRVAHAGRRITTGTYGGDTLQFNVKKFTLDVRVDSVNARVLAGQIQIYQSPVSPANG